MPIFWSTENCKLRGCVIYIELFRNLNFKLWTFMTRLRGWVIMQWIVPKSQFWTLNFHDKVERLRDFETNCSEFKMSSVKVSSQSWEVGWLCNESFRNLNLKLWSFMTILRGCEIFFTGVSHVLLLHIRQLQYQRRMHLQTNWRWPTKRKPSWTWTLNDI